MLVNSKTIKSFTGDSETIDIQTGFSGSLEILVSNGLNGHVVLWGSNKFDSQDFEIDSRKITDNDYGVLFDIESVWFSYLKIQVTAGIASAVIKLAAVA